MKINDVSGIPGVYGPQGPRKVGAKGAVPSAREDKIELSPEAREALALRAKIDAAPEVRQEKIDSLRKAIADGSYKPESREVAAKMLKSKLFDGLF